MSVKKDKLQRSLGGIAEMKKVPDLVFVIDTNYESLAIAESAKLGIPIIAILDSNSNPDNIDYPIPGNDDARRAIDLYCNLIKETINSAKSSVPVAESKKDKLERSLGGIAEMKKVPDLVFVIDTNYESLAIAESAKLGIPIIAILDSNSNPENIDYPIPGNDDARRAIDLYCNLIKETINSAKNTASSNETKADKDIISDDKTKTIQELDREKLEKKFSKEDKEKLN